MSDLADGPPLIFASSNNISTWYQEILSAVDLKALGIDLSVVYEHPFAEEHILSSDKVKLLATVRDPNNVNAKLPKSRPADHTAQYGAPSAESTAFWI